MLACGHPSPAGSSPHTGRWIRSHWPVCRISLLTRLRECTAGGWRSGTNSPDFHPSQPSSCPNSLLPGPDSGGEVCKKKKKKRINILGKRPTRYRGELVALPGVWAGWPKVANAEPAQFTWISGKQQIGATFGATCIKLFVLYMKSRFTWGPVFLWQP